MAMYKKATFSHKCKVTALNKPKGEGWEVFNLPNQVKTASTTVGAEFLDGFDIKEATKEHPDHLYVKVFAIKKDEPNDNGDSFSEAELKTATESFVGVPLFTNHQNDDVEKSRGECVHSWYDQEEGGIYIVGRVDRVAYPRLARGIEEGYITGTSMGCSVENSICSVCHNNAHTSEDYCSHVANRKNRKYTGDLKCSYHNSPTDKQDKCPLCSSTKDDEKRLSHSDQPIFEHNYGLKFIENSFVVNPACHDCGVRCVLNADTVTKKVASFNESLNTLIKTAETYKESEFESPVVEKLGGIKELESLKGSMSEMENVVKSMLKQKENVSMEYVSELVKAMSDVQGIFDELTEMGYGALPSPAITAEDGDAPILAEQSPAPQAQAQMPAQQVPSQAPPQPTGVQTTDMGGLGNVTMPKKSSRKIEDYSTISERLINKVSFLNESLSKLKSKVSFLNENLSKLNKNINSQLDTGAIMAKETKTTKVAAGTDNLDVVTEKQLDKKSEPIGSRTEAHPDGITESKEQLGGGEQSNDTTSTSPQVRTGTYETVTEDQLNTKSSLGDAVVRFNDCPDVITEKQWGDLSKEVAGNLSDDCSEAITQHQIRDLLSNHKFVGDVETITEDQLKDVSMTDGLKRWANKEYSVSLVKTATAIIADMISTYRVSPEEIKKASSAINDDSEMKSKVAFLAVLNSLSHKKENREAFASNSAYFSKTASQSNVSTIDAIILASASNGQLGMRAEDVLDTVSHILASEAQMKKVNTVVASKVNKATNSATITKADSIANAIKELDKPTDGKYQVRATLEDVGAPITDKVAFVSGVKKLAQELIEDESVAAAVIKIEVGDGGELIIDIQDGAESEITPDDIGDIIEGPIEDIDADMNGEDCNVCEDLVEEDTKDAYEDPNQGKDMPEDEFSMASAKKEIKTAQMMGGEMGGQGGAAEGPGAGATLPGTPGVGAPPMESFTGGGEMGGEGELEDNLEPLPPGSICPVCGSDDVNVLDGKGQCGSCASEMTYKVEVNVTKWQGVTPSEGSGEKEEEVEEGMAGEGFEMPTTEDGLGEGPGNMEQEMGEIPAAASVDDGRSRKFAASIKLTPSAIKKVADDGHKIGDYSPATGSTNTVSLGDGEYICADTGTKYKVSYMVRKDGKEVYGQWEWMPRTASTICPSCDRAKTKFVKALSTLKITEADFDKLDLKEQVETIIKLKEAGSLNVIKTASKEGSVVDDYKLAYGGYGKSFPIESCIEKLARRFGENALCLSGPDEGKPLAASVCNRLKKADVYTGNIAVKLANNWSDCDGDEECITHQVRTGYSLRQAASVCSALKIAVAEGEDFLTDELAGEDSFDDTPEVDVTPDVPVVEGEDSVDPFDGGDEGGATVTIELPMDVVEKLDAELDVALGADPADEAHHDDSDMDGVADVVEDSLDADPIAEEGAVEEIGADEFDEGGEMKPMKSLVVDLEENGNLEEGLSEPSSKVDVSLNGKSLNGNPVTADTVMEKNVGKVGKTQMDLSSLADSLNKIAGDKEISQQKAQDSKDIGTYTAGDDGSKMGHEDETVPEAGKPSVPRDNATMGQEDDDLNPQDKPLPVVPSDNATMGHEDEAGLSGGDLSFTGGADGQGKTETASVDDDLFHMKGFGNSKDSLSRLAEKLLEATKLEPKAPVADDADIKPHSDGGTIGKEEKFDAAVIDESDVKSDSGHIGHESEAVGDKPDSPKDHPDVNTGNAQMGHEELDSEKTTKDKGTVIASNDSESEAIRVAGKMLQASQITPSDLPTKINELRAYKPEQIRDIEKAIFAKKGLDTDTVDGMSQTVQINEASNVRNGQEKLGSQIQSLFSLDKQNSDADNDETTQLRNAYKK